MARRISSSSSCGDNVKGRQMTLFEETLATIKHTLEQKKREISQEFRTFHERLTIKERALIEELDRLLRQLSVKSEEHQKSLKEFRVTQQTLKNFNKNQPESVLTDAITELNKKINNYIRTQFLSIKNANLIWRAEEFQTAIDKFCSVEQIGVKLDYSLMTSPSWGVVKEGDDEEQVKSVRGLAIDDVTGNIYLADRGSSGCIKVFESNGNFLYLIRDSLIKFPWGVSVDSGLLFLSCDVINRILKFDIETSRNLIRQIQVEYKPRGLHFITDKLFVCSKVTNTLYAYNKDLVTQKTIQLSSPFITKSLTECYDVICYSDNFYVLLQNTSHVVQAFTLDGEFVRPLISNELINQSFFFTLDSDGYILVSDCVNHCIKVFNPDGAQIIVIGKPGAEMLGDLNKPFGIAVVNNHIFVADRKTNNILQCF